MDIKTLVNIYFNYIIFTKIGSKQRNVETTKKGGIFNYNYEEGHIMW